MRPLFLFCCLLPGLAPVRPVLIAPLPPAFFTTYTYTAYTVTDTSSPDPPTRVPNVGGTLRLNPDSTYEKRFTLLFRDGLHYFNQTGRFTIRHDSIRFTFTDLKGPDQQRGTFRYAPATRRLTLTVFGYPPGNQGVYELMPQPPPAPTKARPQKPRPRP